VARARELIYTGEMIDAAQALSMGLVNAVVPADGLMARVKEVASRIASKGPVAVAQAKRTILRGVMGDLTVGTELETQAFAMLFGTADQREGMTAFLGKRKPEFSGK
jgi:enoyl-CoA hydratase